MKDLNQILSEVESKAQAKAAEHRVEKLRNNHITAVNQTTTLSVQLIEARSADLSKPEAKQKVADLEKQLTEAWKNRHALVKELVDLKIPVQDDDVIGVPNSLTHGQNPPESYGAEFEVRKQGDETHFIFPDKQSTGRCQGKTGEELMACLVEHLPASVKGFKLSDGDVVRVVVHVTRK